MNADAVECLGVNGDISSYNLFAYCGNNPVNREDVAGAFWKTAFDVFTLCASITDVVMNPKDPWAWAGAAGDLVDLVPFVVGVGEVIKAAKMGKFAVKGSKSAKGLIGHDFENYLSKMFGGTGSFKVGGREFDGAIGNRWWEAKSGNYWSMLENDSKQLEKFKSDMGNRLKIATDNGATYELFTNAPIPDSIKQWLNKKGISYTELLD